MDKPKKTEVITIRTDPDTKHKLEEIAIKHQWSVSKTAEVIIKKFFDLKEVIK